MAPTIYWYDLETSGTDPILDRPLQFAGIRTDLDLNVVEAELTFLGAPPADCVPAPGAIAVTGLDVNELRQSGCSDLEFCQRIDAAFSVPDTCVAGYNSLRFDDEFVRQQRYRNLLDPYSREWQSGNSRWDIIDLVRMTYALRPEGIDWPEVDGLPSFRLELLTAANNIDHGQAHDALADVRATIAMAKLIRSAQPRLYDYYFALRQKKEVLRQLYPLGKQAMVHVSSMYGVRKGCMAVVLPLCQHPSNSNGIICIDLSAPVEALLNADSEEIARLVFSRQDALAEGEQRLPLKTIHVNRSPAVATLRTLSDARAATFGIDLEQCEAHRQQLLAVPGVVEKIQDAFSRPHTSSADDADFLLYGGGFFSAVDRDLMARVRQSVAAEWRALEPQFQDSRATELLFRMRARNYPDLLDANESAKWQAHLRERLQPLLSERHAEWSQLSDSQRESAPLQALEHYLAGLEAGIGAPINVD